jgi:hypothetical protein
VLDHTVHYEGTNGPNYTIGGVFQDARGPNSPGIIDSQTDVHDYTNDVTKPNYSPNYPWGPYATHNVPVDTDHDGLPDWWEQIKGSNPNSPAGDFSDANADLVGDGYTELERYLNWLALPHYDCTNGTTLHVDLAQFTRGFTNSSLGAIYAVFSTTNGTVGISGHIAQFTSTISTNGLGSLKFKVTDNTGFSYTNTINIHLVAPAPNTAPILAAIPDRTVNGGVYFSVTNVASDTDSPPQILTFNLPVAPSNAAIDVINGLFHWRPFVTQAGTTNPVTVVVTDNGSPALSATQSFNVIVNPLASPSMSLLGWSNGQLQLTVNGPSGPDYAVQASSNLINWDTLWITNSPPTPFNWSETNANLSPSRYYRIKIGPPLP